MGYFGKSITSSDDYSDFTTSLYSFFGYEFSDDDSYEEYESFLTREMVEGKFEELRDWFNLNFKLQTEMQFLAYHLLRLGVFLTDERIDILIGEFKDDVWAVTDYERKIYMGMAVTALNQYKIDKTPVDIDYSYDYEKYFIYKRNDVKNEMLSVEEITKLFKENGITVLSSLTDMYNLMFLVSDEDYEKLKGNSVFGIKFLVLVENNN